MNALTYKEAAHLLRRMGFSGPPEKIRTLAAMGREKAVDFLVDYEKISDRELEERLSPAFEFLHATSPDDLSDRNFNATELRSWWIGRMLYSSRPFEEKMTLFWHNFFATSLDKVPLVHMYNQNLDLRQFALGRFDDLLLKISQGAAILIWLDLVNSAKDSPNENFARELQELFTMGTNDVVTAQPNFTEDDVKEISRAFTGWRFRQSPDNNSPFAHEWFLDENQADLGAKTIYGLTANFTGEDVITILADRRATARYLVKRLFESFVYPLDSGSPEDRATIEEFADIYFANGHSIRELVRSIFKSDLFFNQRARFALVKNPVEFALGAMRILEADYRFGTPDDRDTSIEESLRVMGMDLFSPPDVFGWDLNLGFVTNNAMLERFNFADMVVFGNLVSSTSPGILPPHPFVFSDRVHPKAKKTAKNFLELLGPIDLDKSTIKKVTRFLQINEAGLPIKWDISDRSRVPFRVQSCVRLIMCLPEFQMN